MFKLFSIISITTFLIMQNGDWKQIEKNGMVFRWKFVGDNMSCSVSAPGKGWVAIGFNENSDLQGSNLIMGAAEKGHFKMSDRYIIKPGLHKSVLSLGVNEAISDRSVTETNSGNTMTFMIKMLSNDKYHCNFSQGKKMTIWLAYSREDDFNHHSIMRTSIKIEL